ncbi:MAG: cytochrome c maturation protein CcmE [Alphaproteobacteria bacterium]
MTNSSDSQKTKRLVTRRIASRKKKRLALIGVAGLLIALTAALVLVALKEQIVFFYAPGDLAQKQVAPGTRFRLGGLVADGSVERQESESTVAFVITDTVDTVPVVFSGILPDLFREGQGVIAEGALDARGTFVADTVLAKHDETYMPREVADSLKDKGLWRHDEGSGAGQ